MKYLIQPKKKAGLALIGLTLLLTTSCEDYLDVSPRSQILTDEHFADEGGYFDQLTGVYSQMALPALYGRELTFGFAEVLSQNYDMDASNTYENAADYNYEYSSVKSKIDTIWSKSYNCIANLNLLLEYMEEADSSIFSDNNYHQYWGEALGLRAFLHFELMRGFASSPASNSAAMGVPYVDEYAPEITQQVSVDETMDLIIEDLQGALKHLAYDSVYSAANRYDYRGRGYYFNYYAAMQTLARAYLWKGDMTNAAIVAQEVIADYDTTHLDVPFPWVYYTELQGTNSEKNRLYSSELVFRIRRTELSDLVDAYFTEEAGVNSFTISEDKEDEFYEISSKGLGNDFRTLYGFEYDGEDQYPWKYHQYGVSDDMLPVIRRSEIYYIAAEALKDTDPELAIAYLNEVRTNRNISETLALSSDLSSAEIQEEIFKEYRKEFIGEGQLFFFYKRLNYSTIEGAGTAANDAIYVWPMPDDEIEFGNR